MLFHLMLVALGALSCSSLNLPEVAQIDFSASDDVLSEISADMAARFADEYIAYQATGIESAALRQISAQLAATHTRNEIFTNHMSEWSIPVQFFGCTTCRATFNIIGRSFRSEDGELNNPEAEENGRKLMLYICDRLDIQTEAICSALFDLNWPHIQYVAQHSEADSRSICGTLPTPICNVKQNEFNWSLKIDGGKPILEAPKADIPKSSGKELKILQVADIHYDPEYVPGALADCDEPLCCRHGKPQESEKQAGYWSDYRSCDSPMHMLRDAFAHMKTTHKIDYIYPSGDIVPHNVWSTTKEGNIQIISDVYNLIAESFPGIPVYPCVGNHESHPTNVFGGSNAPEELSAKWLYAHLYKVWSRWLPAETKETILKGGYYTVSPKPSFRIVSLNSNDCYVLNWWLYLNGTYAIEQLEWLHSTLLSAERKGEYVHILAHIPSGNPDCWTVWAREFNRIIERFSGIVGGIFTSHTHTDELSVHYSAKGHAMQLSWNAGSLTSFSYKNPNYRIYEVEPVSLQVVDHETWIFNLTEANEHGAARSPIWYKEYQFSAEFTNNLSPAGIDALLDKMTQNPELLKKYWSYKSTLAAPKIEKGCDNKCLLQLICDLAVTQYNERTRCKELQAKLEKTLANEPTEAPIEVTTKRPGGAAAISALKLTTLIGVLCVLKCFF